MAMTDDFTSYASNALITSDAYYDFADFPNGGSSSPSNPSTKWECDTGWLYCQTDGTSKKWGYSGRPIDWSDKYFFRLNTQDSIIGDQIVSFTYKSAPFGQDGFTVSSADATDIWLRYQTQYWLYVLQFDRVNNGIVCKKKVPSNSNGQWGGQSSQISNKGVYYQLFTNSNQPLFGAGQQFISWVGVQSLMSAESTKPSFPNLAHDGTTSGGTTYDFEARITTYDGGGAFEYVQIQLYRGDVLVASFVDDNLGTAPNGRTFQQDWNAGYYNNVTGYQSAWGYPIYTAGKSGLRADNIKVWITDFSLTDATPPLTVPSVPLSVDAILGDATVSITWTSPSNNGGTSITGYKLYRGTSSNPTTLLATLSSVLSYTDTAVTNGTTYYYRLKASNSQGDSDYSAEDSATPTATNNPIPPHTLVGVVSTTGIESITI